MKYKVGSLFAGVGGVCLGFKRASEHFGLTFANEMDREACKTYRANFDHNLVDGDIEKILDPEIVKKEREFLLERSEELKKIGIPELAFEEKIVKDAIKKSNGQFFVGIAMSGNFDFSNPLKRKLDKLNIDVEKFKLYIEYRNILLNLEILTEEKTKELYDCFTLKNKEITKEKIDILTAGFPCQAFSIAGDRKGFNDHRGELFYSVLNLSQQLENAGHGKPRVLFLENVKNLLTHDDGKTFDRIQKEIRDFGYTISEPLVMNTYKYTMLPQNRERIFVVCFRDKVDAEAFGNLRDIPQLKRSRVDLRDALRTTLDYELSREDSPELYYTREKYPQYFMTREEFDMSGRDNWINLDNDIDEMYEIYQVRRGMYVRKNQSGVCPTLTANMGTGGHNVPLIKVEDGIRKLSPKDCFNLQGFRVGIDYTLSTSVSNASLYKQAGNAVSVDVIKLIAKKIEQTFLENDKKKSNVKRSNELLLKNKTEESELGNFLKRKIEEINDIINEERNEEKMKECVKEFIIEAISLL